MLALTPKKLKKLDLMHIRDYLKQNALTQKSLAESVGVVPTYIWMICEDKCVPSERLAKKIEKLTNGGVTAAELRRKHEPMRCSHCGSRLNGKK